MADSKKTTREQNRAKRQAIKFNDLFRDTVNSISHSIYGTGQNNTDTLKAIEDEIDNIISKEISDTKSITSDDMSTFLVKLFNDTDRNNTPGGLKDLDDIFTTDSSGLFQFFQERYRNKNLLYEDLHIITSQLYELEEAISSTRDGIITADDISQTISRKLSFSDKANTTSDSSYINTIEQIERDLKLPTKIKNIIIPYTLTYGQYYAYVCPYSKLFEREYKRKISNPSYAPTTLKESLDEQIGSDMKKIITEQLNISTSTNEKTLYETAQKYADNIEIYNDEFSIPLVEGLEISDLVVEGRDDVFKKAVDAELKKSNKKQSMYGDGVVDTSKVDGEFDKISGCYIKYIEPTKIIPVKILDTVIGYYYIHETDFEVNKAPFSTTIRVTNSTNTVKNDDLDNMFLSKITDSIVKSFDRKFLEKNVKFKDMIYNALVYNDLYKKQIKFQFIPKEYIVEFKVNEDKDGDGQSVLTKALFYAKLYLALLIFKMITIITKSNDTKIYYVKNSGMEQNVTNKIQEVARSVRSRQINFMDLLNYNSIISKIGANKEIFMPVGRSGDRGIEFDILAGQDVQLNTDLMEMLRTNMINGTGVPSVIMNYINEADYAKTLTMAHSKFIGRIVTHQLDFNPSITDFYKLILLYSNTSIPPEKIKSFTYTLNPPKSLNTTNLSDIINAADGVIMNVIKAATGENGDQTDDINVIKDIMYDKLLREYVPNIDWDHVQEIYKEAKLEVERRKMDKSDSSNDSM